MKSISNRLFFGVILVLGILLGCQNPIQSEGSSAKSYQPKTTAGKALKTFTNLRIDYAGKAMKIASNYVDMGQIAARSAGGVIDPMDVFKNMTGQETRQIPGRNGGTETVTVEKEMEELMSKMQKDAAAVAPDVSKLLKHPSIDPGPEPNTILLGDQLIDGRTPGGAVTIETLKAQLRGDDIKDIEKDLRKISAGGIEEGRGFYLNKTNRWPWSRMHYWFNPQGVSKSLENKVYRAASEWSRKTVVNLVEAKTFGQRVYAGMFGGGYLTIYQKPSRYVYRSNATVGANASVFSYMNLAYDALMPTVRHEFGHAIGLEHEHQRPDRNMYVSGSFASNRNQAIITGNFQFPHFYFRLTRIRFWIFDFYLWLPVIEMRTGTHARKTAYDYFSIMHYANRFFKEEEQHKVWRAKRSQVAYIFNEKLGRVVRYQINKGDEIDAFDKLGFITPLDIQAVNMMYSGH